MQQAIVRFLKDRLTIFPPLTGIVMDEGQLFFIFYVLAELLFPPFLQWNCFIALPRMRNRGILVWHLLPDVRLEFSGSVAVTALYNPHQSRGTLLH